MSHTSPDARSTTNAADRTRYSAEENGFPISMGSRHPSAVRRMPTNPRQPQDQQEAQHGTNEQTQQQQQTPQPRISNGSAVNMENGIAGEPNGDAGLIKVFNYAAGDYEEHSSALICEDICLAMCRSLGILPATRLLFGLRTDHDGVNEWLPPKARPQPPQRYYFRMRFQVPGLDKTFQTMDSHAYDYLYRQMRYDLVYDRIPELRYPAHKDCIVGFGAMAMYVDYKERKTANGGACTANDIASEYDKYLPRKIVREHMVFVKRKICSNFLGLSDKTYDLGYMKLLHVMEVHKLAPNYLLEQFAAVVDHIPGEEEPSEQEQTCFLKLDLHDTQEPGLKIARAGAEDKLKWFMLGKLESIVGLYTTDDDKKVRLEGTGFACAIKFETRGDMKSFITYVYGYIRLTTNWVFNLSSEFVTPSLEELMRLKCHGPVGGTFSFAKIWEKRNKCGTYLIRQCEKEYDTYYIDINNKAFYAKSCKTETYKIERKAGKWILHYQKTKKAFDELKQLEEFLPTNAAEKFRLSPSPYDKPPLLLICLPKNLLTKKTDQKMSDVELAQKRVQVFDPINDLIWYENSKKICEGGHMTKYKGEWILKGSYGEVPVTLKVLKQDGASYVGEFMNLTNTWGLIYSPQFIKLYGITLQFPYTMIMEFEKEALDDFLRTHKTKVKRKCILDVILGLVRGIVYLRECHIFHGFLRCSNMYVTNFDEEDNRLEAKISDPGYPRPYTNEDRAWIPLEYHHHRTLELAKNDPTTDFWAFATTLWEIVTFGEPIKHLTTEVFRRNLNNGGGILPQGDIPDAMYTIMLDGWNPTEPDQRFDHHKIFDYINRIKHDASQQYMVPTVDTATQYANDEDSVATGADVDEMPETVPMPDAEHAHLMHSRDNYHDNFRQALEIEGGKVIYQRKDRIGEGHYGKVYRGTLQYDNNACIKVAIKVLKEVRKGDHMHEISIMKKINHTNIVKIIASVNDPLCIIMEYVQSGSLEVYARSDPNVTNEKLMRYARDIANGMAYLSSMKIIHRDLAARNILIDNDTAKISDFGLAQETTSDYYYAQTERDFPIMWYALEVLESNLKKFSLSSDIWSYGVTLFEMFSRGMTPTLDPKLNTSQLTQIAQILRQGHRLPKPSLCPDNVYNKLMLPCWHADPNKRPNFQAILREIESITPKSGEPA